MSNYSNSRRLEAFESNVTEIQGQISELMSMMRQLIQTRTAGAGQHEEESGGTGRGAAHNPSSGAGRVPPTAVTSYCVTAVGAGRRGGAAAVEDTTASKFPVHNRAASEPADTRPVLPTGVGPMIDVQHGETRDSYLADTTKTRERTEGAATAEQAMRGDCFSARRVEPGPTTNSTSLGVKADSPVLPCRDDSMVECGAAAFKSCLPSMEMCPSTAAGGLVPTGEASTASETTLNERSLRFCPTEETDLEAKKSWTSVPPASYNSSSSFRRLPATPYCRRVVDTKSGQNRTFDPGGSLGYPRACPFLGSWRALVWGEV